MPLRNIDKYDKFSVFSMAVYDANHYFTLYPIYLFADYHHHVSVSMPQFWVVPGARICARLKATHRQL